MIMDLLVCVFLLIIFWLVRRVSKSRAAKNLSIRLSRVRNASLAFFTLICIGMILTVHWLLGFIFGWPFFAEDHMRIMASPNHLYSSPKEMPSEIFWLFIVKNLLGFFAGGTMLRLLWLYGKGILFSAKNVSCLRFFGYYCIIDWLVDYQMQSYLHDVNLSITPIFAGFVIIFIAWIMDEGRKIQEEQELTV